MKILEKLRENTFLFIMIVFVCTMLFAVNVRAEGKTWLSSGRIEMDIDNDGISDVVFDAKDIETLYQICR